MNARDRFVDFNRRLIDDLRAHSGRATSGPFAGRELLILKTLGARTRAEREHPLAFSRSGRDYVVVGSKGGAPRHPAWYHNLVAHPDVGIEVHGHAFRARARVAEGEEYDRLFNAHADRMPAFRDYRRRTTRKLPVIVLEPIEQLN